MRPEAGETRREGRKIVDIQDEIEMNFWEKKIPGLFLKLIADMRSSLKQLTLD